ncbi:MAG: CRISPR-associated endoribonuclease Cas6 [Treponemataceae bacterium]|nr:CRISPR-associated endoribonuclease Cas6 [Treponemataceae bacterium]
MQLKLSIKLNEPLSLPLSYHNILQAIIYKLLGDSLGNSDLHDGGESYGKRKYKLFVFSLLQGKCKIKGRSITFFDRVSFEIRSLDDNIIKTIEDNALKNGIQFGDMVFIPVECTRRNEHITEDSILINMISPICIHKTLRGTNHTFYLNPYSDDFSAEVNNNFIRKSQASGNFVSETESSPAYIQELISIEPVLVTQKDKYITKYKNTIIEAYQGLYILSGKKEYLDFLYNTGIGSKNSQGFGMFDLVKNE